MRALGLIGPSPKVAWRAYHSYLTYTRGQDEESQDPTGIRLTTEPSFHPDQEVYFESQPVPELAHPDDIFDFLTNVPLDKIYAALADIKGVDTDAIMGKGRQARVSRARGTFIYIARKAGYLSTDLKNGFGFNPGTIAHHMSRYEEDPGKKEIEDILDTLRFLFDGKNQESG
jgi:hypothetical protein